MGAVASGRRRRGFAHGRLVPLTLVALMLALLVAPFSASAQSAAVTDWSPPRTVYIPDTGHMIDGIFLDHWRFNSGISNYGYPITPEFTMGDVVAQYYAYARFEYHPNAADGEVFKLGNIGEELRPMTLPRNSIASSSLATSAVAELQRINRAWLPLSKADAGRESESHHYVAASKHTISNGFKVWWDVTGGDAFLGNPLTQEYVLKGTTYQVFERGQLAWTAENGVWLMPLGYTLAQQQQISIAPVAQGNIPAYSEDLFVEPERGPKSGNGGERWIEINLTTQYFIAWEGDVAVWETYTSTGRPGFDTPPGTYHILTKLEIQDMEGVIGGEYYNVPEVPWVQYFTNRGHAIHGAYWHNNFGAVMSHGCVNLPLDFAAWLYEWTSVGTRVEIHH